MNKLIVNGVIALVGAVALGISGYFIGRSIGVEGIKKEIEERNRLNEEATKKSAT
jgi:uncharacterized protein YneF (UPF0154 family)